MSDHENQERRVMPFPCADHERRVSLIEQTLSSFKDTAASMSSKLDQILVQITRVAVLEEKHTSQQIDVNRAHAKIDDLTKTVDKLAIETRGFINYTRGQAAVITVIGVAVFGLFIKVMFFSASLGMTP